MKPKCATLLLSAVLPALICVPAGAIAQRMPEVPPRLPRTLYKSGDRTLHAFASISEATRYSIVKIDLDGNTVALGAVVDTNGFAVTKASEITPGRITVWLAGGKKADAELLAQDNENDVALIRVHAPALKPITWTSKTPTIGEWAVTPGIEETPQAVGIVSVLSRKIDPKRALIGVELDFGAPSAKIAQVMPGLGAEKAGIKSGDVILAVNDAPVQTRKDLTSTLRNFQDGQTVTLHVQREEKEFDAEVKLTVPNPNLLPSRFNREDRMERMGGELSQRAEGFALALQHDSVLQPWQCGGPLVNLDGKAIGLNIARAGRVASYALPAVLVRQIIDRLKAQANSHLRHGSILETSHQADAPARQ